MNAALIIKNSSGSLGLVKFYSPLVTKKFKPIWRRFIKQPFSRKNDAIGNCCQASKPLIFPIKDRPERLWIEISRLGPTPGVRAAVFGVQSPKLNYQFPARRQITPRRSVMLRESFSPPPAPRVVFCCSLSLFLYRPCEMPAGHKRPKERCEKKIQRGEVATAPLFALSNLRRSRRAQKHLL